MSTTSDTSYDYRRYKVLYVDDEPQAREFFAEVFADSFDIVTAADAESAWQLVNQQGEEIAVIITDQRMPGQQGVDLLSRVKVRCPAVVRILTTAYADQTNAIDAVNSGGVFNYITKPWDLGEVEGVLMRAVEFFLIRRERDMLLREKLSVLQRLIVLDRVRGLAALALALRGTLQHAPAALKSYIRQAPLIRLRDIPLQEVAYLDLRTLARTEAESLVKTVEQAVSASIPAGGDKSASLCGLQEQSLDLGTVLCEVVEGRRQQEGGPPIRCVTDASPGQLTLEGDQRLIRHLCDQLIDPLCQLANEGSEIHIQLFGPSEDGSQRGSIRFRLEGSSSDPVQSSRLFHAAIPTSNWRDGARGDLLPAFFLAYHHSATLRVDVSDAEASGYSLEFPAEEHPFDDCLDADWFDEVFFDVEDVPSFDRAR
jgi:response regulator RpfG family c-di-GMP phosphodiesterase